MVNVGTNASTAAAAHIRIYAHFEVTCCLVTSTMLPPPPIVSATAALNWLSTAASTSGKGKRTDALAASRISELASVCPPRKCMSGVASAKNTI